jgi:hypothetical protein
MTSQNLLQLADGSQVAMVSAIFDLKSNGFTVSYSNNGKSVEGWISHAEFWWQTLKSGEYIEDEVNPEIESLIDENMGIFEFYEDDFRYLTRSKSISKFFMDQIVENFLDALRSGEYFDGGANDGPPYAIEVLASPSLSKAHAKKIYSAVFKGDDENSPLSEIISEYDEGELIISSDDLLEIVKKLHN